jgi:hypothetical protein
MKMEEHAGRDGLAKGFIIKLFGVVLIFLGTLDAMLSWRGGFQPSNFYFWLIGAGLFLYAAGAIRRGQGNAGADPGPDR